MTEVLDFPISGGGFFTQLGLFCKIREANPDYRASICMGTSGGCIACHIINAADFRPDYITNIASRLSYRDYIKTEYTPLPIRAFCRNHLYTNATSGVINELVVPAANQEVEMWTGVFNKKSSKAALLCNRSRDDCTLRFDCEEFDTSPAIYLNGNKDELISSIHASINIPVFMPEVIIRGVKYSDGGGRYASPISSLREEVRNLHSFHLIYISSDNLDERDNRECDNIIKAGMISFDELIRTNRLTDRQVARDLIGRRSIELTTVEEYFKLRKNYPRTMLEVYPIVANNVDILNFDSSTVAQCFWFAANNMRLRMWY